MRKRGSVIRTQIITGSIVVETIFRVPGLGQFFIVNVLGWAINTGILTLLKDPLTTAVAGLLPALTAKTAYTIGYNSAKVVATGVVMFWNFFVNRYWTYNDVV